MKDIEDYKVGKAITVIAVALGLILGTLAMSPIITYDTPLFYITACLSLAAGLLATATCLTTGAWSNAFGFDFLMIPAFMTTTVLLYRIRIAFTLSPEKSYQVFPALALASMAMFCMLFRLVIVTVMNHHIDHGRDSSSAC